MAFGGGLLGAALLSIPTWIVVRVIATNLPASHGLLIGVGLALVAAVIGLLVGAATIRRAVEGGPHLALFSALAAAFGGALAGMLVSVTLTTAYMSAFGQWPADTLNQILFVLAFPIFAGLGWFAGAGVGFIGGLVGGFLLHVSTPGRR